VNLIRSTARADRSSSCAAPALAQRSQQNNFNGAPALLICDDSKMPSARRLRATQIPDDQLAYNPAR
jgi:hypothetical protein